MGVFADFLAQAKTFKSTDPVAQFFNQEIAKRVDVTNAQAAVDAVHTIAVSTQTSGNFTLTITLRNGETFTTGNIAFNAAAATIETAIDSAATSASITGWTNGDISVSGGAVNVGAVVLTFDGASVSGINHPVTVLNDVDGAGGAWGAVSLTTPGQSGRLAWGALIALGVLTGAIPAQTADADPTAITAGANALKVPGNVIRAIAKEAAAEDENNNSYWTIMAGLGFADDTPSVQSLGESTSAAFRTRVSA